MIHLGNYNDEDANFYRRQPDDEASSTRAIPKRQVSSISMPKDMSNLFGAMSNLVNAILGSGIVGIPYAIANAGFIIGLFLLLLVSYLTDKSLRMIVELASFHPKLRHMGVLTYEDLARIPFGNVGSGMVLAGMFVLAYGASVSYLLVIKDTVPAVLGFAHEAGKGSFLHSELVLIVTSGVIVLPLSMMRDMANLEKTSLLSVVATLVLVAIVMVSSPVTSTVSEAGGFGQVVKDNWGSSRLFIGLGVLSTAMSCQHAAFIVSNSLENKTPQRWSKVTCRSISIAALSSVLMGVFGYLGFLDETKGDILNNFGVESTIANTGRILLAITMFFTYPMEAFVARHVLVSLYFNGDMDGGPVLFGCVNRRHQIALGIYLFTLLPALLVNDLGPVMSLTGAVGASFIAYICSGLCYLGINGAEFLEHCQSLLENYGYKLHDAERDTAKTELPITGDATATIPKSSSAAVSIPTIPDGWKPWWWYVGGFPVWAWIATRGAIGMDEFRREFNCGEEEEGPGDGDASVCSQVVGSSKRDFFISIFLVTFGVIAAVVGVASTIYVEILETFYQDYVR